MNATLQKTAVSAVLIGTMLSGGAALAAEEGKSVYLLGAAASMAGMSPPPGTYVSSLDYLYAGTATGAAALSRSLPQTGVLLDVDADLKVKAQVAIEVMSALWVAPQKVLGGNVGFGVLLPVGKQHVDVDVNAKVNLTFPNGRTLAANNSLRISDDTFAIGDPMGMAFIGWSSGNWHWKLTGLVNVPVGSYDRRDLVNMGFNRWAADLTGALTWLDPKSGWEVSIAPGFTFNGENPDTHYTTGTEFHVEGAVMKHLSKSVAIGVAGYHYQQITGDSGPGAVLGPFKGEVSAIGPSATYNFVLGSTPVLTSLRWYHEFNTKNRLEGDAGFLTVTVPLGGAPTAH